MKTPTQIFQKLQQLETKEEMISYLRALPKKDEPWPDDLIDPTGAELTPGDPERCKGNGKEDPMTCCCDECDYYLACFPEAMPK